MNKENVFKIEEWMTWFYVENEDLMMFYSSILFYIVGGIIYDA